MALAAAKDAFSARAQERGNTNAKFWGAGVLAALGGERHWHQVGLRQLRSGAGGRVGGAAPACWRRGHLALPLRVHLRLPCVHPCPCPPTTGSGMLILVFARNHLREHIGEVTTASVACGVLGVGGNKGAVAVEFSVHRRKVAVVCSHFAAHQASQGGVGGVGRHGGGCGWVRGPLARPATCHAHSPEPRQSARAELEVSVHPPPPQGAVEARNANYSTICRQLTFIQRPWFEDESPAAAAAATAASGGLPPSLSAPRGKLGVPADQLEGGCECRGRGRLQERM